MRLLSVGVCVLASRLAVLGPWIPFMVRFDYPLVKATLLSFPPFGSMSIPLPFYLACCASYFFTPQATSIQLEVLTRHWKYLADPTRPGCHNYYRICLRKWSISISNVFVRAPSGYLDPYFIRANDTRLTYAELPTYVATDALSP